MALRTTSRFQAPNTFKPSSSYSESTHHSNFLIQKHTNFITLSTRPIHLPLPLRPPNATSSSHKSFQETDSDSDDEEQDQQQQEDTEEVMDEEERKEWRARIRQVINNSSSSEVDEITDPIQRKAKMEELLSEYPLVVNEEDPDWPEHDDGWGFSLGQFFDKISIKNVRKDDDEGYDSENEIVWQDDDYIRPIKEIKTSEWDEAVFKDISPLVVFVHNRYKRPKENDNVRAELEKVAHIFWNCGLPSPRCVAVDAVVEDVLAQVLGVEVFPEVLFTKAGKILYREKRFRTADDLSKIMGFFYYGAAKPPCLGGVQQGNESIPSAPVSISEM